MSQKLECYETLGLQTLHTESFDSPRSEFTNRIFICNCLSLYISTSHKQFRILFISNKNREYILFLVLFILSACLCLRRFKILFSVFLIVFLLSPFPVGIFCFKCLSLVHSEVLGGILCVSVDKHFSYE